MTKTLAQVVDVLNFGVKRAAGIVGVWVGISTILVACQGTDWGDRIGRAVDPGDRGVEQTDRPDLSLPPSPTASPSPTATPRPSDLSPKPQPTPRPLPVQSRFVDLDNSPAAAAINALDRLGVFGREEGDRFYPNRSIRRSEFARWVVLANNAIHTDDSTRQVRLARTTASPLFLDVPEDQPDFPYIQGLAEAGFVNAGETGEFHPDNLLSRAELVSIKTQLDLAPRPMEGTLATVKQTWGFTDADSIPAAALPEIAADYTLGSHSTIRRVFGLVRRFNPQASVTRAEAALAIAEFGPPNARRAATEVNPSQTPNSIPTGTPTPSRNPSPSPNPTPSPEPTPSPNPTPASSGNPSTAPEPPTPAASIPQTSPPSRSSNSNGPSNGGRFVTDELQPNSPPAAAP